MTQSQYPQYPTRPVGQGYETRDMESSETHTASSDALGLGTLAFTTIMLGAFYANFILPFAVLGVREAVGVMLFAGGIVEILAGMWAFRRHSVNIASIFTAYGGILVMIGYMFLPNGIILPLAFSGALRLVFGFLYLVWAIYAVILMVGTLRTNSALRAVMALLVLAFLFMAFGHFIYNNLALLRIGGWIAIICGLIAWAGTALHLLGITGIEEPFNTKRTAPSVAAVE